MKSNGDENKPKQDVGKPKEPKEIEKDTAKNEALSEEPLDPVKRLSTKHVDSKDAGKEMKKVIEKEKKECHRDNVPPCEAIKESSKNPDDAKKSGKNLEKTKPASSDAGKESSKKRAESKDVGKDLEKAVEKEKLPSCEAIKGSFKKPAESKEIRKDLEKAAEKEKPPPCDAAKDLSKKPAESKNVGKDLEKAIEKENPPPCDAGKRLSKKPAEWKDGGKDLEKEKKEGHVDKPPPSDAGKGLSKKPAESKDIVKDLEKLVEKEKPPSCEAIKGSSKKSAESKDIVKDLEKLVEKEKPPSCEAIKGSSKKPAESKDVRKDLEKPVEKEKKEGHGNKHRSCKEFPKTLKKPVELKEDATKELKKFIEKEEKEIVLSDGPAKKDHHSAKQHSNLTNTCPKSLTDGDKMKSSADSDIKDKDGGVKTPEGGNQKADNVKNHRRRSKSKSGELATARRKSGRSSEHCQVITRTTTTNATIERSQGQGAVRSNKEGGEKLEMSGKWRKLRSFGQGMFAQKKAGKGAPPLLSTDLMLLSKYRIQQMIGGGGFGQIYKAFDESKKRMTAVKVIPCDHEPARMVLEQMVLLKLRGANHIPTLYASGCTETTHFMVMELLGKNLSELKRKESSQRFSLRTVAMCGLQSVNAIKIIHDADFIHRDIKPSNFCIGIGMKRKRTIYLLDFGMVRRFRRKSGQERKKREFAGFRGTMRYASFNVHLGHEQTPVDDFISLYYSFIELGEGSLPWKAIKNSNEVKTLKLNASFVEYCKHLPKEFDEFLQYLLRVYEDNVHIDYEKLKQLLRKHLPKNLDESTAPFDWEIIDHSLDAATHTSTP